MIKHVAVLSTPRLFVSLLTLLLLALVGSISCYVLLFLRPDEKFFTYNPQTEQIQEIQALNKPNVSTRALLSWAAVAATATYTVDFLKIDDSLEALKDVFTREGHNDLMNALNASGRIEDIKNNKLLVSAVLSGPALIIREGILKDKYTWNIQVPMLLTYQGASESSTPDNVIVELVVTTVSTFDAPKGIGVAQLIEHTGRIA